MSFTLDVVRFTCLPCSTTYNNKSNYTRHLDSNKHKLKLNNSNNIEILIEFKCELCNVAYNNRSKYTRHLNSNKHKLNNPNNTELIIEFKCELCNVTCNNSDAYMKHLKTKKHNMNPEEHKEMLKQMGKNANIHGVDNELFMISLLETLDFENVVHVGNTANMFDICVKFKDEDYYRGLQIKTLVHYHTDNYYAIVSGQNGYEDDTLIIAVTNNKDKYVLMFYNEMKKGAYFSETRNVDRLYNLDTFKIKLIEAARKSTIVDNFDDYLPPTQKLESESIYRFKCKCDVLNISFLRNTTNFNEIDAFVNNYNVQFKAATSHKNNAYQFSLARYDNGNMRPYSEDDRIDFFIFEIADEKYQTNFFLFPNGYLLRLNIYQLLEILVNIIYVFQLLIMMNIIGLYNT